MDDGDGVEGPHEGDVELEASEGLLIRLHLPQGNEIVGGVGGDAADNSSADALVNEAAGENGDGVSNKGNNATLPDEVGTLHPADHLYLLSLIPKLLGCLLTNDPPLSADRRLGVHHVRIDPNVRRAEDRLWSESRRYDEPLPESELQ